MQEKWAGFFADIRVADRVGKCYNTIIIKGTEIWMDASVGKTAPAVREIGEEYEKG